MDNINMFDVNRWNCSGGSNSNLGNNGSPWAPFL